MYFMAETMTSSMDEMLADSITAKKVTSSAIHILCYSPVTQCILRTLVRF